MTEEDHIWLQYNVTCKGQKVQLVKAAHAHTQEMMEMMCCSSEHYTKLYIIALSSLAEEYTEWKASSQPSIHTKSPPLKSHKPQEEVSLPPEIEVNVCKRGTPFQQDLSTSPNQPLQEDVPSSWWRDGVKPYKCLNETHEPEEEVLPPHEIHKPKEEVPPPSHEIHKLKEEVPPSHKYETKSLFEPQRKYEAPQASNNYNHCQDTFLTIRNKTLPAV